MKGVILAGGLGTRLMPLTAVTNKHLLPIYDQPMIFYPIQALVKAGITQVMIVTGGPHAGHFLRVLKNGQELGLDHLEYAFQEGAGGIPVALSLAEDFADGEPVAVVLGDNTTDADITQAVQNFEQGAMVFLKQVLDPERFGVPQFKTDQQEEIVAIEEKPTQPKSDFAVTGLYLYDNKVFDIIRTLEPSDRGELEITDVNNHYLDKGQLDWFELAGFWSDAGTPDSLFKSNQFWVEKKQNK